MKIRKNLLVVCEGSSTEPNYFHDLRNMVIEKAADYTIEIRPKPPEQSKEEIALSEKFTLRNGGRKRVVTDVQIDESDIIEEAYKAQPTRYVREAQLGIVDGTFDEAWAVFDLNGHSDHEEAFNLARTMINGKKIHIGFSSISFETWILWHFEKNITPFPKSQCRTGKKLHNCGQSTHEKDCKGSDCITGYLKIKGHVALRQNIKAIKFKELESKVYYALTNAYNFRQSILKENPEMPYYKFIPYTTVDRLVFKLLNIPVDYQWVVIEEIKIPNFDIFFSFTANIINIKFVNISDRMQVINVDFMNLVNVKGERVAVLEKRILKPTGMEVFVIELEKFKKMNPVYLGFKLNEDNFQITEIPVFN